MAYQFDFLPVLQNSDLLLRGALFTLELTAIGTVFGVSLGIVGAVVRAWNIRPFAALFGLYVELIRNTPFLVQLFFIFFGLPSLGLKITEWQAAVLAMVINLGAYSTEIIRAGIQAIPKGQMEAARSLGVSGPRLFFKVYLPLLLPGTLSAALLVFVDVLKEMPATLLMRPFGWDTLAVRIFEMTSEGEWARASLPALTLVLVGLLPVIGLIRRSAHRIG